MKSLRFLALGFSAVSLACAAHAQAPASLYTHAQAEAGASVYAQSCAMCHGTPVPGKTLLKGGGNPTIGTIFSTTTSSMPLNQPGSLSHEQYENVLAYALQKNGYQAGAQALSYNQALTDSRPFVNKPQ